MGRLKKTKRINQSPQSLQATVRRAEAYKLRLTGMSYDKIGDALGVAHTTAYHLVNQYAKELQEYELLDVKQLSIQAGERLEALIHAHWNDALVDPKIALIVAGFIRDERQLFGMDARPDAALVQTSPFMFNINFGDSTQAQTIIDVSGDNMPE